MDSALSAVVQDRVKIKGRYRVRLRVMHSKSHSSPIPAENDSDGVLKEEDGAWKPGIGRAISQAIMETI